MLFVLTVKPEPIDRVVDTLLEPLMLISELNVRLPLPDIAAVALFKFAVDNVEASTGAVILSVFPEASVIPPLTVSVDVPEIVDVPLLAVVIDGNDLFTSISRVPPALIVMLFAVGINDA